LGCVQCVVDELGVAQEEETAGALVDNVLVKACGHRIHAQRSAVAIVDREERERQVPSLLLLLLLLLPTLALLLLLPSVPLALPLLLFLLQLPRCVPPDQSAKERERTAVRST
jgi:hypothetical protein